VLRLSLLLRYFRSYSEKEVKKWISRPSIMNVVAVDAVAGGRMTPEDSAIVVFGVVGAVATN
jgi:hypothetical protein